MEFAYDGGGLGKGGTATLYVDGDRSRDGRVERTHVTLLHVRRDHRRRPRHRRAGHDRLPGRATTRSPAPIKWVRIDLGDDSHDHLISPETHFAVAMTRQ